jgi:hypothetical protein
MDKQKMAATLESTLPHLSPAMLMTSLHLEQQKQAEANRNVFNNA